MISFIINHPTVIAFIETYKNAPLLIISEDGQLINRIDAPTHGWDHHQLCMTNITQHYSLTEIPIDAFLGDKKIGSSNVIDADVIHHNLACFEQENEEENGGYDTH